MKSERNFSKLIFLLSIFCFCETTLSAQKNIDSLKQLIYVSSHDTSMLDSLLKEAENLIESTPDDALKLSFSLLEYSEKLNYKRGIANAYSAIGYAYYTQANYDKTLEYWLKSLSVRQQIGDSDRIAASLGNLGNFYYSKKDYDNALDYYHHSLKLKEKIGAAAGIAATYSNIGNVFWRKNDWEKALKSYNKALFLYEKLENKARIAIVLGNIGNIYAEKGDSALTEKNNKDFVSNYHIALDYYMKSMKIKEELNDLQGLAFAYGNIGSSYTFLKEYHLAEKYLLKALSISAEQNLLELVKNQNQYLSNLYQEKGDFSKALLHYQKYSALKDSLFSEEKSEEIGKLEARFEFEKKEKEMKTEQETERMNAEEKSRKQKIIIWSSVGGLFFALAFSFFIFRSLRLTKNQKSIIENQKLMVDEKNKKLEEAFGNIEIISKIGEKITSTLNLDEVVNILYEYINSVMDASGFVIYIYNPSSGNLEMKYKLGKHERAISDSIPVDSTKSFCAYSIRTKKEVFINDVKNEYSKFLSDYYWSSSEAEIVQSFINVPLLIKDDATGVLNVQSFKKNAYTKYHLEILKSLSSYVAVALNNAGAYSQLNAAKENLFEQKKIIENKNKDILASINYAKRLQQAILPPERVIKQCLENSFILYKPKDIVAGDFYWMETTGNKVLFASVDCTGHGVPGAFMSILGFNGLNRCVKEFGLTQPAAILDKLCELVDEAFSKSEADIKDGMDIALCAMEFPSLSERQKSGGLLSEQERLQRVRLEYSGAGNSLYHIRENNLVEYSADKQPVGKFSYRKPFNNHIINLQKNDSVYIFTDGYADQFGGPKGKKFKYAQLEKLLLSIQDKSMTERRETLNRTIDEWRGELEQVDDICIIGVRI